MLHLNLYGNPSGTYYYIEGILEFLRKIHPKLNEAESCLIRVEMPPGTVIEAIAVDEFLVTAQTKAAMDEFYTKMQQKYDIKRLVRPTRYLG